MPGLPLVDGGDVIRELLRGHGAAAYEDGKNRLLVWGVASRIRLQRGMPENEVVRVMLHDKGGTVLFEGDVR